MATAAAPEKRLTDAALKLLAKRPWREITLSDIARAAKIPLKDLPALAPGKPALLALILKRFGDELTRSYKADRSAETARDRLFDVGMAWFDALAKHREAVRALYQGLRSDPFTLLDTRSAIVSAAEWLMTLAEADTGPALSLRALAFAVTLGRAVPVWLDDDADLSKTMARLDGDLRRGEGVLGKF